MQDTQFAQDRDLDAAVLDENLHGQRSYPAADALVARGVPFIFVIGDGGWYLHSLYPGRPVIAKPCVAKDLIAALSALMSPVS